MKLKQKPEDFAVTESWRFEEVPKGEFRVYAMDKQKVSTLDAIGRIAKTFGLPRNVFSFCGLKDKQGRTRQLIAVRGADVDLQDEDLRLNYLGRSDQPLSAKNTTSNRFGVTVRDLDEDEAARLPAAVAEMNRLGVINYFDSQRFGSLKHGQGFIAKDLLRGDFEAALHNYLARPSDLDRSYDAKVKAFWRDHWGQWKLRCSIPGADKYDRVLMVLRRDPQNFRKAFLAIDPKYRALLIFEYQSWLWNEGIRRLLIGLLPHHSLMVLPYQAGTLLFPRDAPAEVLRRLRTQTFPLLAPDSKIEDPDVRKAVDWVIGREKLTLSELQVPDTKEIFFRHEERPVLVYPGKLLVAPVRPDELNRGRKKVYIAFTLPPGAYATLVVRRLFHFSPQVDTPLDEERALAARAQQELDAPAGTAVREEDGEVERARPAKQPARELERPVTQPAPERRAGLSERQRRAARAEKRRAAEASTEPRPAGAAKAPAASRAAGPEAPGAKAPVASEQPQGFRARQKAKKAAKAAHRAARGKKV